MHIGQPIFAALETVEQPLVVEAELMQNGGLEVVHVHFIFGDLEAELVAGAVGDAAFHAAAGHPLRVHIRIMIAPEHFAF